MENEQKKVQVDEELMDLVPGYLERVQKNISEMRSLAQEGQYEKVRVIGHNLKGSGGGYGFEKVSEIGAQIEKAARDSQADMIVSLCDEMEGYLKNVEIEYVK